MHATLMQDLAATIAADRRRDGERARAAAAVAARSAARPRRLAWPRRRPAHALPGELDAAPRV
jgi:hypothetical protein